MVLVWACADPLLSPYGFPSAHSFPRPLTTPATLIRGSWVCRVMLIVQFVMASLRSL